MKKINIHYRDEMEKNIALKSQRNALMYISAALFIWVVYDLYKSFSGQNGMVNLVPPFLLCTTAIVQNISEIYLKKNMVKEDDEYQEKYPFSRIMLIISFFSIVTAGIFISLFIAFYIEWV